MELTDNKSNNNNYTYNLDDNNNSNTNYNFLRDRKIEEELTQSSLPSSFDDYCDNNNNNHNNINDDENDDDMIIHIPLDEMENNSKHRKRYRAPSPCLEKVLFPMMMSL